MHVDTPSCTESLGGRSLLKLKRDSAQMHRISVRKTETKNLLSSRVDESSQGVCKRILLTVKFKRKSAILLSLLELTKLRKNNEIEVSKGKVFICLEDEWKRSVWEEPRYVMTIGYGKEHES